MAGVRARGPVLAIALTLSVLLPASAMGATSWQVGDFKYVKDVGSIPASGPITPTSGTAKAACGSGWDVVGGGAKAQGLPGHAHLSSTGIGGARHWFVESSHVDEAKKKLSGYAVCVRGQSIADDTELQSIGAGPTTASNDLACPSGFVYGGGVRPIGDPTLWGINGTLPVDLADAGTDPDDGWRAYVLYGGGSPTSFLLDIVCGDEEPEYASKTRDIAALGSRAIKVKCGGGHVTGGGGVISGSISQGTFVNTYPVDLKDSDKAPDDGWSARANNIAGGPKDLTVYAVCL